MYFFIIIGIKSKKMPILIIGINNILKFIIWSVFYGYFPFIQTSIMECLIDHAFTHQDSLSIVVTITVDSKLLGLLHNNSSEFNDNLMHVFNHLPTNGIRLVFTQSVLHLQDIKKLLHIFKICQKVAKF
jgi:hypothetical protein